MKKVLLATALLSLSMASFAKDITKTSLGEVAIEDNKLEVTTAQGKKVVPVDDGYMFVNVEKTFTNDTKDNVLVLIQASSGGNGCPAMYFVVDIHKNGEVKKSPDFGTCSDIPKITYLNNSLVLTMPELNGKKVSTFKYQSGVVTKNGKVVK